MIAFEAPEVRGVAILSGPLIDADLSLLDRHEPFRIENLLA